MHTGVPWDWQRTQDYEKAREKVRLWLAGQVRSGMRPTDDEVTDWVREIRDE